MSVIPDLHSSLSDWLDYLENLHNTPIDLGLERVQTVAKRLGLLKPVSFVFTVGGTNGKGTTCRVLETVLLEAGYRVGVYSSPHLIYYTERIRIMNNMCSELELTQAFSVIEKARQDISLTYFEFGTLAALILFKQHHLDVIILEVGLGGRLDATNIVDSDVAVITSIALDHIEWLGNSREEIGKEKAGIFRADKPAIVGEPDSPKSITIMAQQLHTKLNLCYPNEHYNWGYKVSDQYWDFYSIPHNYHGLPLVDVPLANAATALAALTYSTLSISIEQIKKGLQKASLIGRFQIIAQHPLTIVDVAHNPHAAAYLSKKITQLRTNYPTANIHAVVGMLHDKDIAGTIMNLLPVIDNWYCASLDVPRGATNSEISQYLSESKSFDNIISAWESAIKHADKNDIIIIFGSFVTVSQIFSSQKELDSPWKKW